MEKELLQLFLPAGLLDRFDIERYEQAPVKGSAIASTLHIYLVEKNQLPPGYDPKEWESKGFCEPRAIQDFSIRANLVYLVLRRRRWRSKLDPNKTITSDLSYIAEGAKMTAELSAFLKDTARNA